MLDENQPACVIYGLKANDADFTYIFLDAKPT